MEEAVKRELEGSIAALSSIGADDVVEAARLIASCLKEGGKVLLAGNGGSAADCQHIAGELVGRFRKERSALPAISLATDTSVLTALTNDYGGKIIFKRQVEALGAEGDVLIAFSTSGTSPNILEAVDEAKKKGMKVVGFTGKGGEKLRKESDVCIIVDSADTPRIQEAHITAAHIICGLVEESLFGRD